LSIKKPRKPKTFFFVSVIKITDPSRNLTSSKTVSFFNTYKEAKRVLTKEDVFEDGWYEYAVIEEIAIGANPFASQIGNSIKWFKVIYTAAYMFEKEVKLRKIKTPRKFKNVTTWSIG